MRYHHQYGATKPKKGIKRFRLGLFAVAIFALIGYGLLMAALPSLGGWPFKKGDETALRVRTTAPGHEGDRLYIPRLNVTVAIAPGAAVLEGQLGEGKTAVVRAQKLGLALTPQATIENSPFARLSQLKDGDEFFIDYNGTRFAYSIDHTKTAGVALETTDKSVSVRAKPIGVVAWNDGAPRIETIN